MVNCKKCKNHLIVGSIVICKISKDAIPESSIEKFPCNKYVFVEGDDVKSKIRRTVK